MFDLSFLPVLYQVITLNSSNNCLFNYSAGADLWRQCGFGKDFIQASLTPWQWVTGGYFSMFVVCALIGMTYLKYHKATYPLIIGSAFLPISYGLFPEVFLAWAIIFVGMVIGIIAWYIYISQTSEM